jgi:hypothetical protein
MEQTSLAESSKEGYGSKRAVLAITMMMIVINGMVESSESLLTTVEPLCPILLPSGLIVWKFSDNYTV